MRLTTYCNRGMPWLLAALVLCAAPAWAADVERTGGPYVPTPQVVVDQMLRIAGVRANDYVIDLGSGDGIIVLTAATQFKAAGMGVDIDPDLVRLSNDSAQKLSVADRVRFVQQDVFKTDLGNASVLTLYLLPGMMSNLRAKIFNELKPGVRVVSHDYHFGNGWLPDDSYEFAVPEKAAITGLPTAIVYLWIVPARIAGTWQLKVAGGDAYEITLRQRFQSVEGSIAAGGKPLLPRPFTLRGNDLSFALQDRKGVARFTGHVNGEAMEGTVELPGGKARARWTATRTTAANVVTE